MPNLKVLIILGLIIIVIVVVPISFFFKMDNNNIVQEGYTNKNIEDTISHLTLAKEYWDNVNSQLSSNSNQPSKAWKGFQAMGKNNSTSLESILNNLNCKSVTGTCLNWKNNLTDPYERDVVANQNLTTLTNIREELDALIKNNARDTSTITNDANKSTLQTKLDDDLQDYIRQKVMQQSDYQNAAAISSQRYQDFIHSN